MSKIFCIKNRKKLFNYEKVLTVEEALLFSSKKLEQFNFDEEDIKENPSVMKTSLKDINLVVGVEGESTRGFELHYENELKSYTIRINTPSSRADWFMALDYMKLLATYLKSDIEDEENNKYTPQNIGNFSFFHDIEFGLEILKKQVSEKEHFVSTIFGIHRPVCLNKDILEKISNAENPVEELEKFMYELQYMDAYSARQILYRNKETSEIYGRYALSENLRTILPYEPFVEFHNMKFIENNDVSKWELSFVKINDDSTFNIVEMDYSDFIKYLPKERYQFIDATYILVEKMDINEVKVIFKDVIKI